MSTRMKEHGSSRRFAWASFVVIVFACMLSGGCGSQSHSGDDVGVDNGDDNGVDVGMDVVDDDGDDDSAPPGPTRRQPVVGTDISEETGRLLEQVAALWAGQDADFDGDYLSELKVTAYDPAGETKVDFYRYVALDTLPRATWTLNRTTGDNVIFFDPDLDGVMEGQTTETTTGREILEDRNDDGTFDWRRVEAYQADGTMTITISHSDGADFIVDDEYTTSRRRPKCGKPNAGGAATEGSEVGGSCLEPMPAVPANSGVTVADSGQATDVGGWCSSGHTQRLFKAFDCAAKRIQSCLGLWNRDEKARFDNALHKQALAIDCALKSSCGANAATDSTGMSFLPAAIDGMSDDQLCTSTFHEMMHWAGTPDDGKLHGDAVDRVYACARFCDPTCPYIGEGAGQNIDPDCGTNAGADCAVCADSDTKGGCGYMEEYLAADASLLICRKDGTLDEYAECPVPVAHYQVACDGEIEYCMTPNPCCVACDSGYINEFSCDQWMGGARPGVITEDMCSNTECEDGP